MRTIRSRRRSCPRGDPPSWGLSSGTTKQGQNRRKRKKIIIFKLFFQSQRSSGCRGGGVRRMEGGRGRVPQVLRTPGREAGPGERRAGGTVRGVRRGGAAQPQSKRRTGALASHFFLIASDNFAQRGNSSRA